jgi:protein SCO1/2
MIYIFLFLQLLIAYSKQDSIQVGIDERLGEFVDVNMVVINSNGDTLLLKDILEKPTVLSLVYYNCPGICNVLLSGLRDVVERADMEPGIDYNILSLSFNHNETYELAKNKKQNYIAGMNRKINNEAWYWVVSDSVSIRALTDAIGFKFKEDNFRDGQLDFLHAGALVFLSPEGKITRYLNGTEFLPFNLKMAAIEAAEGRPQPTINKVLEMCFKYDPEGRGYVLNVTRIFGIIITLGALALVLVLTLSKKKKTTEVEA